MMFRTILQALSSRIVPDCLSDRRVSFYRYKDTAWSYFREAHDCPSLTTLSAFSHCKKIAQLNAFLKKQLTKSQRK